MHRDFFKGLESTCMCSWPRELGAQTADVDPSQDGALSYFPHIIVDLSFLEHPGNWDMSIMGLLRVLYRLFNRLLTVFTSIFC